jgi:hypothetical protein
LISEGFISWGLVLPRASFPEGPKDLASMKATQVHALEPGRVLGRDFAQDAEGGKQNALIGNQTCGGIILRGTIVPTSPRGRAREEGIRQSLGTEPERSLPSPVRSSGQDKSTMRGAEQLQEAAK